MAQGHAVPVTARAPIPEFEEERVSELMSYDIVNTLPEDEFDALTNLASRLCDLPISMINFISSENQFTKSCTGITIDITPRSQSICQYTILKDELFEIKDLSKDPRFQDMPYVKNEPKLRYYAGVPLLSDNGHAIGSLCIMDYQPRSLTEQNIKDLKLLASEVMARLKLRKREKSLEQMNSFKNKLIKVVGHDIRSPLTGIMGAGEFLEEADINKEELSEIAQIIQESAGQIQYLINDLLDVELAEFGKLKHEPEPTDISNVLEEIDRIFRFSAQSKNISLKCSFKEEIPDLQIDRKKCIRVLSNIITNAIKFTPRGGKVSISCRFKANKTAEESGIVMTMVKDNGIGMSEEQLNQLFKEKSDGGRSGTENESSYGLGMLIVKKLCEICGASISVESEVDKGTTFRIKWPVKIVVNDPEMA
ncbi:GAF domain-containing sensor histidine kinase [Balneolaceae bacterium YR4-1]|uniref:histidine kinase n=1 Tax=Halalkalibaculum roseum TaxID=2709311 RepID=A0A6M1T0Q4_9BACT|nr:GAF domain-containing sensor histidine kinase [Halalkalibaculum roseum]NGP75685.1 GAF domain-containing sensor histidine kinase [Halalkalibaculum roseum]